MTFTMIYISGIIFNWFLLRLFVKTTKDKERVKKHDFILADSELIINMWIFSMFIPFVNIALLVFSLIMFCIVYQDKFLLIKK